MLDNRLVLVVSLVAVLALAGCLNSITFDTTQLDGDGDQSEDLDGPETVVSAAPGSASQVESGGAGADGDASAPYIESGNGDRIAGFALDELKLADRLENQVNDYRQRSDGIAIGHHEFRDSASLSTAARFQSRRLASNVLRLYSSQISNDTKVLNRLSAADEDQRERRFMKHGAAECNSNIQSLDRNTGDVQALTADVVVSGETVEAVSYGEIAANVGGSGTVSDETRVAGALFDVLRQHDDVKNGMLEDDFRYQGVGITNVPSERVMIVVQDYC